MVINAKFFTQKSGEKIYIEAFEVKNDLNSSAIVF